MRIVQRKAAADIEGRFDDGVARQARRLALPSCGAPAALTQYLRPQV
ncbi:MAG TPA: hypothetical protein VNZ53_57105 [Steroidobacteraceae bacterium]|jgi:hypothetical protein|nr:hypothetical protein [Steroidobacteraceae bacterium]